MGESYQELFGLNNATLTLIEHADAMVATVYKVERPGKNPQILKISSRPNDILREVYFLQHFAGLIPVPRIIQHEKSAILMECLPGDLLKDSDLNEHITIELGSILAKIHLEKTNGFGDLMRPETLSMDPKVSFREKFEEGMNECAGHLPKPLLNQCQAQFNDLIPLLDACDGPCIVHRDFRPGNVMIDKGEIQGVIDWASARSGFAEEDFSSFEDNLWADQSGAFLKGYASIRPVPDYARILPLLRLNKAIASIGFTVKRGTWNGKDQVFYQRYLKQLESFKSS